MAKSRIAIVPAGNPKDPDARNRAMEARGLYISGYVDTIVVSGGGKQVQGLTEIILGEGTVQERDVIGETFSKDMYDTLDMFVGAYNPENVELVCYLSQEDQRKKFENLAGQFLNKFTKYEFYAVAGAKQANGARK
jgi:hypothetical protein